MPLAAEPTTRDRTARVAALAAGLRGFAGLPLDG